MAVPLSEDAACHPVGWVATGEGDTLAACGWLEGVAGIVWRRLTDVRIESARRPRGGQ
jgi:hypothetical protein